MTMQLNKIRDNQGATAPRKRVGRGIGSGLGKTCGHGQKGQKARSGVAIKGFEGGQMPIQLRVPKRGFNRGFVRGDQKEILNLGALQVAIDAKKISTASVITASLLSKAGLIRSEKSSIRVLAKGDFKSKVTLEADHASKAAVTAIEKNGGEIKISQPKSATPRSKTKE